MRNALANVGITLGRTIQRAISERTEKSTKTGDPRVVAVLSPLADVFEAQRRWLAARSAASGARYGADVPGESASCASVSDELVWFRGASALDTPLRRVAEAAALPPVSLQSFRRTFENVLRKAGVDQIVRRSLAGWSTEDAQGIYAGVDSDDRAAAGEAVMALVRGRKRS